MSERHLKKISRLIDQFERTNTQAQLVYKDRHDHLQLVEQHLNPCGNDVILLTIKGHLLVEHLLEVNLIRLLDVDRIPRLGFRQKLQLLSTIVEQREAKPNADLFLAISTLNDTRNQLAHNLKNPQEMQNDLQHFINEYHKRAGTKRTSPNPSADELKTCILQLCNFLHEVRIHLFRLKNREQNPE